MYFSMCPLKKLSANTHPYFIWCIRFISSLPVTQALLSQVIIPMLFKSFNFVGRKWMNFFTQGFTWEFLMGLYNSCVQFRSKMKSVFYITWRNFCVTCFGLKYKWRKALINKCEPTVKCLFQNVEEVLLESFVFLSMCPT